MRSVVIGLLATTVAGCAAAAATSSGVGGWQVDSRIVIAVFGAFSLLFWRYLDHREKSMQKSFEQYAASVNARLDDINRQLKVVSRVEVELASLPLLTKKLDDTAVRLSAHELEVAKNYASYPTVQSLLNTTVQPLKESLSAIHRRLDENKGKPA